jgi:hypothetical protein
MAELEPHWDKDTIMRCKSLIRPLKFRSIDDESLRKFKQSR